MVRALYTGWTGMLNEQKRLDIISNNMANATTVGFKKEGVTSQSFREVMTIKARDEAAGWKKERIGTMRPGVKLGEIYTDYTQGSLRETGNTYDLAIGGDGFFQISVKDQKGDEHIRYTRAGQFKITQDGHIVDVDGNNLMSESGELQVPVDAADVMISKNGNVYADGELIDRILVKDFEDYDFLKKIGYTMYEPVNGAREKDVTGEILQGYTEQSNVNVVREMVNLIEITRSYETSQKVIKSIDSTLELAANSVGKVG